MSLEITQYTINISKNDNNVVSQGYEAYYLKGI